MTTISWDVSESNMVPARCPSCHTIQIPNRQCGNCQTYVTYDTLIREHSTYGFCPVCPADVINKERTVGGHSYCGVNHKFRHCDIRSERGKDLVVIMRAGRGCQTVGCDNLKCVYEKKLYDGYTDLEPSSIGDRPVAKAVLAKPVTMDNIKATMTDDEWKEMTSHLLFNGRPNPYFQTSHRFQQAKCKQCMNQLLTAQISLCEECASKEHQRQSNLLNTMSIDKKDEDISALFKCTRCAQMVTYIKHGICNGCDLKVPSIRRECDDCHPELNTEPKPQRRVGCSKSCSAHIRKDDRHSRDCCQIRTCPVGCRKHGKPSPVYTLEDFKYEFDRAEHYLTKAGMEGAHVNRLAQLYTDTRCELLRLIEFHKIK